MLCPYRKILSGRACRSLRFFCWALLGPNSSDSNAFTLAAAMPRAEPTTMRAKRGEIDESMTFRKSIRGRTYQSKKNDEQTISGSRKLADYGSLVPNRFALPRPKEFSERGGLSLRYTIYNKSGV